MYLKWSVTVGPRGGDTCIGKGLEAGIQPVVGRAGCLVTRLRQVMPWEVAPLKAGLVTGIQFPALSIRWELSLWHHLLVFLDVSLGEEMQGPLACCLGGRPEGSRCLGGGGCQGRRGSGRGN